MTSADGGINRERYLARQVEFIRDTDASEIHEVIVKMRSVEPQDPTIIKTVAEAMRRRGVSTSARDVLPVSKRVLDAKSQQPRTAAARQLRSENRSLAATVAQSAITEVGIAALRAAGLSALQPLLTSDVVQQGIASVLGGTQARRRRPPPETAQPTTLWTASSAVLQVRDQDLPQLCSSVPNIEEIHPNRRLFVPPVVAPKQVPQAVEDNKVSSWGIRMIGALSVWGAYDRRGEDITVGLLDTGVDPDHPDLAGKIAAWAEFDERGNEVSGSQPHDSDKHGTHCAGVIVGGKASGRWIGVSPKAKLAAAMVLNGTKGGTDAQVLAGIQWAIERHVDVISMSLGGLVMAAEVPGSYTRAMLTALKQGIPVVCAVGNDGNQTSGSPGNDFLAFAVGATDHFNRAAGFSGGRTQVIRQSPVFPADTLPLVYSKPDVSAPGVAVYSSVPKGEWEALNGTSMATPHVAGAIALLLSATTIKSAVDQTERAFVIQDLLTGSAEELGEAGQNHRFGFGRIDVLRAIGFASELGYGLSS
jgi:subtilisin family serine protease